MQFEKGNKKPIGSGRVKGSPNRKSYEIKQKLLDLNCDPQEYLALLMTGREKSLGIHPFFSYLKKVHKELPASDKAPTPDQWKEIMKQAKADLKFSQAGLNQRINIALNLLKYTAPQLKAVEHSGSIDTPDLADLAAGARSILQAKLGHIINPDEDLEKG